MSTLFQNRNFFELLTKLHLMISTMTTVWKLYDFSATQILREINFVTLRPKNLHFNRFISVFDIFKCEIFPKIKIQSLQNGSFWGLQRDKIDFT